MNYESRERAGRFLAECALGLSALATMAPAKAAAPLYELVIAPPIEGIDSVYPSAMGFRGPIVGNAGSDPYDPLAAPVVFTQGSFIMLELPTDSLNFVLGCNELGLLVGTSGNFPYYWKQGQAQVLQPAGGYFTGLAFDANDAGQICGAVYNDLFGTQYAAYWAHPNAPGVVLPGLSGIPDGGATTINEAGQIGGVSGGFQFGARWDDPTLEPIQIGPIPGAVGSEVLALNSYGDCAGRSTYADGAVEAMLYVEATGEAMGLGYLNGPYSFANGINRRRQVVGNANAGTEVHAFLWDSGTLHDLNDLIASSSEPYEYVANAVDIDDHGRIAAEVVVSTGSGTATRLGKLVPLRP